MPGRDGGAAGGQQPVAVVEAVQELVDAEDAQADGGQFDGEGQPVQAPAQPGHGRPVGGGQPEAGDDGGRAVGEQGERRVSGGVAEVAVGVGHGQRPYVHEVFLGQPEPVPAGGEDADAGGAAQQGAGEVGAGGRQVLAVVDDEQQPAVAYALHQGVQGGPFGAVVQTEGVGGGERDEGGVVQAGEVHEAHAVGEGAGDAGRDPAGQAGLADAAGPGEGDQPGPGQQLARLGEFGPPVDEAGGLHRQVRIAAWR